MSTKRGRQFSLSASLWTMEQLMAIDHHSFTTIVIGNPFCLAATYGDSPMDSLVQFVEAVMPYRQKAVFALPVAPLQSEIELLDEMLSFLEQSGVGGVEVQSHALARKVKKQYPSLPIYFGSFANVHTTYCAKDMAGLGAMAGSLPFELEGGEQREIMKSTGMMIYVPILGKFPVSFSQGCHFHLYDTDYPFECHRECMGETVVDFGNGMTVIQKGRALFSQKALNLLEQLPLLDDEGFSRFRIEGSLMDGNTLNRAGEILRELLQRFFGAGIFDYCRGKDELESLFPDGFCNGFFFGRRGMDYVEDGAIS